MMPSRFRNPIQIVEIDLDQCIHTYGTLPCQAVLGTTGAHKCFGTDTTCQSRADFVGAASTLRFARNVKGIPKGQTIFPVITSVRMRETEINVSGVDPDRGPLGQRARITVRLQDFTYHDRLTDPYQTERVSGAAQSSGQGYDPSERGTFFTKLRARNSNYVGKDLRLLEGEVGDDLSAMRISHYVIEEWRGPDASGNVEIVAQDVLQRIASEGALAPKTSRGRLSSSLSASANSLTLVPAGIGSEYSASGVVTIGRELIRYERTGDVLTLVGRGVERTTADNHDVGDLVQEALEISGLPGAVINRLISEFTEVPDTWLDPTTYAALDERWMAGFDLEAIIPRPELVEDLIAEVCQVGVYIYGDRRSAKIRYGVNRPLEPGEQPAQITARNGLLRGTASVEDRPEERSSAIIVYHKQIDPTEGVSASNFDSAHVAIADALGADSQPQQIRSIYLRWFGTSGNSVAASIIAERLKSRFEDTPRLVSGEVDISLIDDLEPGGLAELFSRIVPDATGEESAFPMQLQLVEESDPNNRLRFKGRSFQFRGRFGFIMLDGSPNYDNATAQQRAEGLFLMDENIGLFSDGTGPYQIF